MDKTANLYLVMYYFCTFDVHQGGVSDFMPYLRSLWLSPLFSDFLVEYLTEQEQEAAAEGAIYL